MEKTKSQEMLEKIMPKEFGERVDIDEIAEFWDLMEWDPIDLVFLIEAMKTDLISYRSVEKW